jgi:hypothetical protein
MDKNENAFACMHRIAGDPAVTLLTWWIAELLGEQLITASQARDIKFKLNKDFEMVLDAEIKSFK